MYLLILLASTTLSVTGDGSCKMIDWLKHSDTLNFIGSQLTQIMDSSNVNAMLKKFDPYSVSGDMLEQMQMEITHEFMYEYKIAITLAHLKLGGHSKIKVIPIEAVDSRNLRFAIEFDYIDIKGKANILIHQLTQTGCEDNEEKHGGLCYKKCSLLTHGTHVLRTAAMTCAINDHEGCAKDKERHQGLCYTPCKDKYKGVGPKCWGICDQLFGKEYKNIGLRCTRKNPRDRQKRPRYNRGSGDALYKPWTKGPACKNFGASGKDKCPPPYYRICTTERLQIKGPGECKPSALTGDFDIRLKKVRFETTFSTAIQACTEPVQEGELLHKDVACVARALVYIGLGALNPEAAGSMLENFGKFKSMVSSLQFEKIKLTYASSSKIDIDVKGTGFVGWAAEKIHNFLKKRLNTYRTLIDDLINKNMLDKLVKTKANKIIAAELAGNKCN